MSNETKSNENSSPQSSLYYFYTVGCGFCKKVDPIVDELISEGHEILKLDLADGDNRKLQEEVKKEYSAQCGTPWFVDGETGNQVCGYREKDVLEKWAKGEKIPEPPKPKGPPPPPPQDFENKEEVATWKEGYKKWSKENDHLPNLPKVDDMLDRLKKQKEMMEQRQQQMGAGNPQLEGRISSVERKLDLLMKHLGVPVPNVQQPPQQQGPTIVNSGKNKVEKPKTDKEKTQKEKKGK